LGGGRMETIDLLFWTITIGAIIFVVSSFILGLIENGTIETKMVEKCKNFCEDRSNTFFSVNEEGEWISCYCINDQNKKEEFILKW
jgi:hypothetical protein